VLIIMLMSLKGCIWVLEQPQSSIMEAHPRFQWLAKRFKIYKVLINMRWFGALTDKPSWIYSNSPLIKQLLKYRRSEWVRPSVRLVRVTSGGTVTGSDELKSSQAYPTGLGHALCDILEDNRDQLAHDAAANRAVLLAAASELSMADVFGPSRAGEDRWSDADLTSVIAELHG
jgi:hypothetical protein